ncbi:MAG: hypothetical protein ACREQT_02540 [Candidatus Binataceae bacterium]
MDFSETRRRLLESDDFADLRRAGHELKDGVVLTSVSDVAFEMSFKCIQCAGIFWFENLSWRDGEIAEWRLSQESCDAKDRMCSLLRHPVERIQVDRRLRAHP